MLVNPFTMALWGLIVAGSLAIGFCWSLPVSRLWCPFSRTRPGISTARLWNRLGGKPHHLGTESCSGISTEQTVANATARQQTMLSR